jgi:hypothetical protein
MAHKLSKSLRRCISALPRKELEEYFVISNVFKGNILLASCGFSGLD